MEHLSVSFRVRGGSDGEFFFPFFVCSNHRGAELPIGEGQGGEFLVKFLDKRQGGEAMEVSHFLFFYL